MMKRFPSPNPQAFQYLLHDLRAEQRTINRVSGRHLTEPEFREAARSIEVKVWEALDRPLAFVPNPGRR